MSFLNLALDRLARSKPAPSVGEGESTSLYFIRRQLNDLTARYLPDRAGELRGFASDKASAGGAEQEVDAAEFGARSPGDIQTDAIETRDPKERDSLYAQAALAWLSQRDLKLAQSAALAISDDATRDRVLLEIARRCASEKRLDLALAQARRLSDVSLRSEALVMLGNTALASGDRTQSLELLNEAENWSLKARPSIDRARSLMKIAGAFCAFDPMRSFDALQLAIRAINETIKQQEDSSQELGSGARASKTERAVLDDSYVVSLQKTLTVLAKSDFDRALLLAQQLSAQEASVIAQLAVCQGGLIERPPADTSAAGDEAGGDVNH